MKFFTKTLGLSIVAGMMLAGCTRSEEAAPVSAKPAISSEPYLLTEEPAEAKTVIAVREDSKDQDEIVIVGRIGGSTEPFVDGRAAFTIVDQSLKACSDIPGDNCAHPWDYCCETDKLPGAKAMVKIVDSDGKLIEQDAKSWLKLKELQTVVIKGTAERDDAGNLTVLASGLFVRE